MKREKERGREKKRERVGVSRNLRNIAYSSIDDNIMITFVRAAYLLRFTTILFVSLWSWFVKIALLFLFIYKHHPK